jgi:cell wall-associated NlpC family hydrolase
MIFRKVVPPKISICCFLGITLLTVIGCAPSIRYTRDITQKSNSIKEQQYPEDSAVQANEILTDKKVIGNNLADSLESAVASYIGSPYRAGGMSRSGFDCSGFVCKIFMEVFKIELPRSSSQMKNCGRRITLRNGSAGDLVFFRNHRIGRINHVGIYMGKGRFVHASAKQGVTYSNLNEPYYLKRLAMIRRIFK